MSRSETGHCDACGDRVPRADLDELPCGALLCPACEYLPEGITYPAWAVDDAEGE